MGRWRLERVIGLVHSLDLQFLLAVDSLNCKMLSGFVVAVVVFVIEQRWVFVGVETKSNLKIHVDYVPYIIVDRGTVVSWGALLLTHCYRRRQWRCNIDLG